MKHFNKKIKKYWKRYRSICVLGCATTEKLKITKFFITLPIKKRLSIANEEIWKLQKNDKKFNLFFDGSEDPVLLLEEIFVREEYKIELTKPEVILDLGANIGLTAMYYSMLYPNAKILCFEPSSVVQKYLKYNASQFSNITVVKKAVGGKDSRISFFEDRARPVSSSILKRNDQQIEKKVDCYSLDKIFNDFGLEQIDLLKLDIEGAEKNLLLNCSNLSKVKHVIGEIHHDLVSFEKREITSLFPHIRLAFSDTGKNGRYIVSG